ncbi:hypothetical protein [Archangium violaceum]|uniref:hypothetical protein n=1 Tax=Archangium violaceum TaxID=83451 RepID=UPI0036DA31B9
MRPSWGDRVASEGAGEPLPGEHHRYNKGADFSQRAELEQGQSVDFVVGNGGDGYFDDAVRLEARITR